MGSVVVAVVLTLTGICVMAVPGSATARPVPAQARAGSSGDDACGPRPVKPDGSLWTCTLVDNFDGSTLDRSLWTVSTHYLAGSASAYACAIDDPSTVDVSGGSLNLTVRRLDAPYRCPVPYPGSWTPYVAGTVSTVGGFSQQYGRFEARIRDTAATVPGLHEAFWMWPAEQGLLPWPSSGEIDISETYSVHPDRSFPYLHSTMDVLGARPGVNTAMNCAAPRGAWNTYTLDWTPKLFEFYVNGQPCLVTGSGDVAFQRAYVPILTQALGQYNDSYDGRAPLPASMNVDYVKAWK